MVLNLPQSRAKGIPKDILHHHRHISLVVRTGVIASGCAQHVSFSPLTCREKRNQDSDIIGVLLIPVSRKPSTLLLLRLQGAAGLQEEKKSGLIIVIIIIILGVIVVLVLVVVEEGFGEVVLPQYWGQ